MFICLKLFVKLGKYPSDAVFKVVILGVIYMILVYHDHGL